MSDSKYSGKDFEDRLEEAVKDTEVTFWHIKEVI